MPSLNKTSELGLNQWSGSDYPKRDDFNNDNLIVDNAIKDLRKRIAGSLSDLNALKALDTTGMADNILIAIKALGIYRLDKTSILAANDTSIIEPAKGTGRWINILYDANNYTDIKTDAIMDILRKGAVINPEINFGMNNKITIPEGGTSVQPKFTFKGKHSINLLGKDGNCEDVSKAQQFQCTTTLDENNKKFGAYAYKGVLTATMGYIFARKKQDLNVDNSKYYCFSAYVKNGNATNMFISNERLNCSFITGSSDFTRTWLKLSPSDMAIMTNTNCFCVCITGTSGQYGYADGIMLEEITADQYNDANYVPTPYHDSYSCLRNPYIEILHDNLIRNGNGEEEIAWWKPVYSDDMIVVNPSGWTTITTAHVYGGYYQQAKLKKNTDYYINGVIDSDGRIAVYQGTPSTGGTWVTNANYHFNTGNNEDFYIALQKVTAGSFSFSKIMLIEGTTAPIEYKPCKIERVVLEGKLADGDTLTYQAGKAEGQKNWLDAVLYGKDYNWQFGGSYTGYKQLQISSFDSNAKGTLALKDGNVLATKYDGKIITDDSTANGADHITIAADTNILYLSVSNADSGWTDAINPNNNQTKVLANGWKASMYNTDSGKYLQWKSIIDNSYPSISYESRTTVDHMSTAVSSWELQDASGFKINDYISVNEYSVPYKITAINGNTITTDQGGLCPLGGFIRRVDAPGIDDRLLNYCINNVAPGFEGWQLHAKLKNPEPITDYNCIVKGDVLILTVGDNYIYVDAGQVIGEIADVQPNYDGLSYVINSYVMPYNPLKEKLENFEEIYKNRVLDSKWFTGGVYNPLRGNNYVKEVNADYDTKATYNVDYKILATIAPLLGSVSCEYNTAVFEAISELEKAVQSRQVHDSALDNLISLSKYERKLIYTDSWYIEPNRVQIDFIFHIIPKQKIPKIKINDVGIWMYEGEKTNLWYILETVITDNMVLIRYRSTDSTVMSSVQAHGVCGRMTATFDSR